MLFNSGRAVKAAGANFVSFVRGREDDDATLLVELCGSDAADAVLRASAKAVAVAELNSSRSVAIEVVLDLALGPRAG